MKQRGAECRQGRGRRRLEPATWAVAALTVALAATALVAPTPVSASQSASCDIPMAAAAPPGPGATAAEPIPAGAAIIQIEGQTSTPVSPAATPAATPAPPTPDPVEILTQELTALSEALAACLSDGDVEMVVALAGERYLGQMFGGSVPLSAEEFIALASQLTPIPTRIVAVEEAAPSGDDRATAVVSQVVGNQLMRAEWTFSRVDASVRADGESRWRLDGERQISPSPPSTPRRWASRSATAPST